MQSDSGREVNCTCFCFSRQNSCSIVTKSNSDFQRFIMAIILLLVVSIMLLSFTEDTKMFSFM